MKRSITAETPQNIEAPLPLLLILPGEILREILLIAFPLFWKSEYEIQEISNARQWCTQLCRFIERELFGCVEKLGEAVSIGLGEQRLFHFVGLRKLRLGPPFHGSFVTSHLTRLRKLDVFTLGGGPLTHTLDEMPLSTLLKGIPTLRSLVIRDELGNKENDITESLNQCPCLEELWFIYNNSSFDTERVMCFDNLRSLSFTGTPLVPMGNGYTRLVNLEEISFGYCSTRFIYLVLNAVAPSVRRCTIVVETGRKKRPLRLEHTLRMVRLEYLCLENQYYIEDGLLVPLALTLRGLEIGQARRVNLLGLGQLNNLESLYVTFCDNQSARLLTDESIQGMTNLTSLRLESISRVASIDMAFGLMSLGITNAGLSKLTKLVNLYLRFIGSTVTLDGLKGSSKTLQKLHLHWPVPPRITHEGYREFISRFAHDFPLLVDIEIPFLTVVMHDCTFTVNREHMMHGISLARAQKSS